MMIKPGISELMENMDSRYTLVSVVAKRARVLAEDSSTPLVKVKSDKPVTIAVNEVAEGMLDIIYPGDVSSPKMAASENDSLQIHEDE